MLQRLQIENYTLIDRLDLEFHPGLNVLTGETGSGKSIVVDAVELLLGDKAFQEVIRSGSERAKIVGVFSLPCKSQGAASNRIKDLFESSGIDFPGTDEDAEGLVL